MGPMDRTILRGVVIGTIAMAIVVTVSNVLVRFPINDWLTWAAFSYPISFLVTDLTNRRLGVRYARRVVLAGFICALFLSMYFSTPRIAVASLTAFLVAQLLDVQIFDKLRGAAWWRAPFISSSISSAVDTALFFSLAFAGTASPLEKSFRETSGDMGYAGGFIEHYIIPIIYPAALDMDMHLVLGYIALAINLVIYALVIYRYRQRTSNI